MQYGDDQVHWSSLDCLCVSTRSCRWFSKTTSRSQLLSYPACQASDSCLPVQDKLHKEEDEKAPEASGEAAQQSTTQSTHHLPPELVDDVSPISLVRHVRPLLLAVTTSCFECVGDMLLREGFQRRGYQRPTD